MKSWSNVEEHAFVWTSALNNDYYVEIFLTENLATNPGKQAVEVYPDREFTAADESEFYKLLDEGKLWA